MSDFFIAAEIVGIDSERHAYGVHQLGHRRYFDMPEVRVTLVLRHPPPPDVLQQLARRRECVHLIFPDPNVSEAVRMSCESAGTAELPGRPARPALPEHVIEAELLERSR